MTRVTFHKPIHGPPSEETHFLNRCLENIRREKKIQVEYEIPAWESWQFRLQTWTARERRDVIYIPGTWLPELAAKGILTDLSENLPQQVESWAFRYPSSVFEMGRVDGEQYGIPVYGAVWCFMYNAGVLEEAGFTDSPSSWDELLTCARRVQTVFPDLIPYGINDNSDGHFADHGYIYLFAGGLADFEEGGGTVRFDNRRSVEGLAFLQQMVKEGLANPPAQTPSNWIREQFFAGKIAMTAGPSDWVLQQRSICPEFPLRVGLMPCPAGGAPLSYASCGFYCITSGSGDIGGAAAMLEQLMEPQLLERHIRTVGMLPLQNGMSLYDGDLPLSVFLWQVRLSGSFPAAAWKYSEALTREMLACLNLEKSPEAALREVVAAHPSDGDGGGSFGKFGQTDISGG